MRRVRRKGRGGGTVRCADIGSATKEAHVDHDGEHDPRIHKVELQCKGTRHARAVTHEMQTEDKGAANRSPARGLCSMSDDASRKVTARSWGCFYTERTSRGHARCSALVHLEFLMWVKFDSCPA